MQAREPVLGVMKLPGMSAQADVTYDYTEACSKGFNISEVRSERPMNFSFVFRFRDKLVALTLAERHISEQDVVTIYTNTDTTNSDGFGVPFFPGQTLFGQTFAGHEAKLHVPSDPGWHHLHNVMDHDHTSNFVARLMIMYQKDNARRDIIDFNTAITFLSNNPGVEGVRFKSKNYATNVVCTNMGNDVKLKPSNYMIIPWEEVKTEEQRTQ